MDRGLAVGPAVILADPLEAGTVSTYAVLFLVSGAVYGLCEAFVRWLKWRTAR
ncbi:hypothetical protein [Tsukamurella tyrosinosolvens]|uniref:hypothetical protein n=1 Tax=Tsukamurella tyrosinosolvens TaxID=57704 RepID=UPI003F49EC3A